MQNFDEVNGDEIVDNDINRGCIKYPERYDQSKRISFEGMITTGKCTPTDIDGFHDYNGEAFVFIEGKKRGKRTDFGQRTAFTNLIAALKRANVYACYLMFEHDIPVDEIIIAKDQIVSEYCDTDMNVPGWRIPAKHNITIFEYMRDIEKKCLERGLKIYMYPNSEK